MNKVCKTCNEAKNLNDFNKHSGMKDGHLNTCKLCRKVYMKKYVNENSEILKEKSKTYYKLNSEKRKEYNKKNAERNKELRHKRKSHRNKLRREKYKNDINYRLETICRKLIYRCFISKSDRTYNLLGYTTEQLKKRIEFNFKDGMSWNNYGEWHIDHIKPVCAFDKDISPNIINALCNLRPLWASDNMSRNNKNWKEDIRIKTPTQ